MNTEQNKIFYPIQVPNLLNEDFKARVCYKEYQFEEFSDMIMCIWTMESMKPIEDTIRNMILPDACLDVVIDCPAKTIGFAGFSKTTEYTEINGECCCLGIRFKPAIIPQIYNQNGSHMMDNYIQFELIEQNCDLSAIFACNTMEERISILVEYLREKKKFTKQTKFTELPNYLHNNPSIATVDDIAAHLNYSTRQINRIFKLNYGMSPKTLLNIVRLHKCLHFLMEGKKEEVANLALSAGFYDQPHFIKEIKKYCAVSPLQFFELTK
ncbi:hypothetical protein AGMMS50284_2740 [Clostridia bacterium]|nr:hypothetical protein AGMMS50284_2740 [Clostridia bacterium]